MSAVSANDSRVRPKVFGSSTTDIRTLRPDSCGAAVQRHRQGRYRADDNRPGALAVYRRLVTSKLIERAAPHLLLRPGGVGNDRRRRAAAPAEINQAARNL